MVFRPKKMDNIIFSANFADTPAATIGTRTRTMKRKDGFTGERAVVLPRLITDMMESDPVMSILHITDMGYYPKALHHYRERPEPIDQYVFIYCVDGRGFVTLGGRRHEVLPDQYFILPAGHPHAYGAAPQEAWTIYWIHFKGSLAPFYCAGSEFPATVAPGKHSRISERTELFEEILNTLNSGLNIESLRYAMSLLHHYLASLRYIGLYRGHGGKSSDTDLVETVIHYMNENLERRLTLGDIARYSGFSVCRLSSLFKLRTGHTPLNYFNLLKVRKACSLLDTTPMRLNQICFKVGISDPYYFSRMFAKIMGMSPKAYRNRPRG